MAKKDIDVREREELDIALEKVDKVVMRKYISEIEKRPVFIPSYDVTFSEPEKKPDIPVCVVGTNIMLDVEPQQRVVEGESGGTRPDVIAKNNTDKPITVFGVTIQPGETISVECKCGGTAYMTNQLNNHIPNQLSGQEGTKILLTTSDIKDTESGLADSVCEKYGATLVITDVSVSDVEKAIKEVANA